MIQIKKTILTLVALLALTTQAWAQGKLIYEKEFSSDTQYPFYLDAADKTGASATISGGMLVVNNPSIQTQNWDVQPEIGVLTSAAPITQGNTYRVVMQYKTTVAGSVTFALGSQEWTNTDWKGQSITVSDAFQTCEAYFDDFPYSNTKSHLLLQFGSLEATITIKKVEIYELYPFDGITWTADTQTATIAEMPAGNVIVTPEYYAQAMFATEGNGVLTPKAAEGAIAGTTAPLIEEGTVAKAGQTDDAQGQVMYAVTTTADAAPALSDFNAIVPTAEGYDDATTVYVWYYIQGADAPTGTVPSDDNTFSDSDISGTPLQVNVLSNKFTLTFDPAPVEKVDVTVDGQAATPTQEGKLENVKMGKPVKLTAKTGYKLKKVEVKKTQTQQP